MSSAQTKSEFSNPLVWTIALVGFVVFVAWYFAYMFKGGVQHALNHPVHVEAGPTGPAEPDHSALISALDDDAAKLGKAVYAQNCVTCHGADGGVAKVVGARNFNAEEFGNGNDPYQMYLTLTEGYSGGVYAMPAQNQLDPEEKYAVIHYIREAFVRANQPSTLIEADDAYLAAGSWPAPSAGGGESAGYHGDEYVPTAPILGAVVQQHAAIDPKAGVALDVLATVAKTASDPGVKRALKQLAADSTNADYARQIVQAAESVRIDDLASLFTTPGRTQYQPSLALLTRPELIDLARTVRSTSTGTGEVE